MALRSVAARKRAAVDRQAKLASLTAQAEAPADQNPAESLSRVCLHMDRLHELMSKAKTDREWTNFTRAYERLFKVWMVLSKTPGPGQRKVLAEVLTRRQIPRVLPAGWQGPGVDP